MKVEGINARHLLSGFATAQCGKALPYRSMMPTFCGEAQPRRVLFREARDGQASLTALGSGKPQTRVGKPQTRVGKPKNALELASHLIHIR